MFNSTLNPFVVSCILVVFASLSTCVGAASTAKKSAKLFLVIKDGKGGYTNKRVAIESMDGGLLVKLSQVAKALGKRSNAEMVAPVEQCLSSLGFKSIVDTHRASYAQDPTVYVYVSEWEDRRSEEFRTMVTLGASIVAGGDATKREKGWPPQLKALMDEAQSSPVTLFSMGIGSNALGLKTVAGKITVCRPAASERLDRQVIANNPDLVIIGDYALLESRFGTTPEIYREELTDIVRRIHEKTRAMVLLLGSTWFTDWADVGGGGLGPSTPSVQRQFSDITAEIARKEGCLYVELLDAFGDTDWALTSDRIHPNDLGHRLIANRIFEVLARNCSCLSKHTRELEKVSPPWRNESALREGFELPAE